MTFRSTLRNIFSEKILFLAKIKQFFRFSSNSSTMKKQSIFVSRTFQSTIVIVSQINCARTRYNDSSRLLLSSTLHTLVRASLKIKRARKDMWVDQKSKQAPVCVCVYARVVCTGLDLFPPGARDAENQYGIFSFRPVNSADMNFSADRIPPFVSRTAPTERPTSSTHCLLQIIIFFFSLSLLWRTSWLINHYHFHRTNFWLLTRFLFLWNKLFLKTFLNSE